MRSGGADYAFRLCQYLAVTGIEVHVLTGQIESVARDERFVVYPRMRKWSWKDLLFLVLFVKKLKPDVVNLHFTSPIYNDHPMVTFVPGLLKKFFPSLRVVTLIEYPAGVPTNHLPLVTRCFRKVAIQLVGAKDIDYEYGTVLRDSDKIIILSELHKQVLVDHFTRAAPKCVLVPPPPILPMCEKPGVELRELIRNDLGIAKEEFVFAYYGYIYPNKGIDTLLKAFAKLARRKMSVRLLMIGGSNEVVLRDVGRPEYPSELVKLSISLSIDKNIVWTGYYPSCSDEASRYLYAADACVLPFDDGVTINRSSFAAAVSHGLPTITTEGPVLESPFVDRINVLLCPPKNGQALAAAMDIIIKDSILRGQLHIGATAMAEEWFSWNNVVQRTVETFEKSVTSV